MRRKIFTILAIFKIAKFLLRLATNLENGFYSARSGYFTVIFTEVAQATTAQPLPNLVDSIAHVPTQIKVSHLERE